MIVDKLVTREGRGGGRNIDIKGLKHRDAFNRTWWSVLSIDKLSPGKNLLIERTGGHVVLKASACVEGVDLLKVSFQNGKDVRLGRPKWDPKF